MIINQGCSSVHCLVATLVGQLGLVWAMGLRLTDVAGQLGCPDCTLVCAFKVGGNIDFCLSASPTYRAFQLLPQPFGKGLVLTVLYTSCCFKLQLFKEKKEKKRKKDKTKKEDNM